MPNPFDDKAYMEHHVAEAVAMQTMLRRLIGTFFMAGTNTQKQFRDLLFRFEQNCIADIGTREWPGAPKDEQDRVKSMAATYLSDFLSPIADPKDRPVE